MSSFFKNIKRFSITLGALILAITLAIGSLAYWVNGVPNEDKAEPVADIVSGSVDIETDDAQIAEPSARKALKLTPTAFNAPDEMRGVFLVPGTDFFKSKDSKEDTVRSEIDAAVQSAQDLSMNSVIIDTVYSSANSGVKVLYHIQDAEPLMESFDIMQYAVEKIKEAGLHAYAIFDVSATGAKDTEQLSDMAAEFAEKYALDGVLIDGYAAEAVSASYSEYTKSGGSMGYDNYIRQTAAENVKAVVKAVHKVTDESTQAGLLASAVWANAAQRAGGSDTNAKETALFTQNADTKSYVERKLVDFIAVKAYAPVSDKDEAFGEIVSWWGEVAENSGVPMYTVCASSKIGAGFGSDEIKSQLAVVGKADGCEGYIFNNLGKLADNPSQLSASTKKEALTAQPMDTKPTESPVKVVETSAGGNAAASSNDTQEISSYIELIKEISPTGLISAEPGDTIKVTALVRSGSTVRGTIDDTPVFMTLDSGKSSGDSDYAYYTGTYTVPDDYDYDEFDGELDLGALSVYANYGDREESYDGAYFKTTSSNSSKKVPVQLIAEAKTFPVETKDNVPIPTMYPLPKGATDYVVGEAIEYTSAKKVKYTFSVLASGMRVESQYLKQVSEGPKNNSISGMSVTADDDYTYVTLKTKQQVTYSPTFKADSFQIQFHNTTGVPTGTSLKSNPLFTKASWSDNNKLTLTLAKTGGFLGFKGYYDKNGNLVFRFNNPPSSIKKARIAIDPGHGGKDFGALGSNADYPEKVLSLAIAKKLEAELTERGATVLLMDSAGIEGPARAQMAEKWEADFLVSIHCNTSSNTNAAGTEVFYFYPYSKQLATNASLNVSRQINTLNRGAKLDYYHVTLSSQMASVLVECGFMTNKTEYAKLMKSSQQKKIATGVADALEGAIKTTKTGISSTGTQSTGSKVSAADEADDDDDSGSGGGRITDLYFEVDEVVLNVGETKKTSVKYEPGDADDKSVKWTTSSKSIATVDENGRVTGVKAGTTTVKATAQDGSKKTASYKVVVAAGGASTDSGVRLANAGAVYLEEEDLTIYLGSTERVEIVTGSGKTVLNADFTWKSSDTSIATVDEYGVVTARAEGYATITAKGGGKTLSCEVDVSRTKVAVTGIDINKTTLTLLKGKSSQLAATLSPRSATNKNITWSSSNSRLVSVDSKGVIKAENQGKATITAKSKDGSYKATCTVTVVKTAIDLDDIDIQYDTLELRKGDSDILYLDLSPSDTTDTDIVWTSSNKNVVTVDEDGAIIALKKGTATITATSKTDKRVKDTCKVTVFE